MTVNCLWHGDNVAGVPCGTCGHVCCESCAILVGGCCCGCRRAAAAAGVCDRRRCRSVSPTTGKLCNDDQGHEGPHAWRAERWNTP